MTVSLQETVLDVGVNVAGLEQIEAERLWSLIANKRSYTPYEELVRRSEARATAPHSNTDLQEIGHSQDDPSRGIHLATVGDVALGGVHAYIEGPEHAPELLGAETTDTLHQLSDDFPDLVHRLGYDSISFCSHIDPDGMLMQKWNPRPTSLRDFVLWGYRGAWWHQPAWDYPAPGYEAAGPEALASLGVLRTLQPTFFGAMHASNQTAFHVASRGDPAMGEDLAHTLEAFRLPINYAEPEAPGTPILAPGLFQMARRETLEEVVGQELQVGTSAIDHVPAHTLVLASEVPWMVSDILPGDPPTNFSRLDAIRLRTKTGQGIIQHISMGLDTLDEWIQDNIDVPEVRRLYEAAAWWRDEVSVLMESELQYAEQQPPDHRKLRQSECLQLISRTIINSLLYLGNVYQLARMAQNGPAAQSIYDAVDFYIRPVERMRYVSVRRQVGAQALCTLIGMKHAADAY